MEKRVIKILGMILFLIGIVLILNSFLGITGFVVSEVISRNISFILGFTLILGGYVLIMSGRKVKEGRLIKIIRTSKFEKAIKKHPKKPIEAAIAKIGTGLANEEPLRYLKGKKSIKTSQGGRIVYSQKGKIAELNDYSPDHKYGRK